MSNPPTLAWAVRLLYLQCVGLIGLTGYLVVLDATRNVTRGSVAVALIVSAGIAAAAVGAVARALMRRAAGARGPAIVLQFFLIAAGCFVIRTGPGWLGAALALLGLTTGLLIVLPPSTRALGLD